jgi:cytochrome b
LKDLRAQSQVRVWDWPTRAFHWLLVLLILNAWFSHRYAGWLGDPTLILHRWNGYAILVLLVFRLIWGFVGSSTARFRSFVPSPRGLLRYIQDFLARKPGKFLGHNPLGTMMILALLAVVSMQAVLGLFTLEHNELVAGPLKRLLNDAQVEWVSKLHLRGLDLILIVVAIHILANVSYTLFAKEPLIKAMVTGRKPAATYVDALEARIATRVSLHAFLVFLAAIGIVFGGIMALGGRIF